MNNHKRLMTGLFPDRESAEMGYKALLQRGYTKDEIKVAMSEHTKRRYFASSGGQMKLSMKAVEKVGARGAIGGTVDAIVAALSAVSTTIALPGLGLVIASPLALVAGNGAGPATNGGASPLAGWSFSEDRAKRYTEGIRVGSILMGVWPRSDEDAAHLENEWRMTCAYCIFR